MKERIRNLKWRNKKKEREDRKNKIIIKGMKWRKDRAGRIYKR